MLTLNITRFTRLPLVSRVHFVNSLFFLLSMCLPKIFAWLHSDSNWSRSLVSLEFGMFQRSNSTASQQKLSHTTDQRPQDSHDVSLSRSLTAVSVDSISSVNNSFETHWLPSSSITTQKCYNITLKLKPREIDLLKKSWAVVTASENGTKDGDFNSQSFTQYLFCIQFYNNLMAMNPLIERLVPNIKHQASAFAGVLSATINTLDDLSKMKDSLANLGRLHARILGIDSPYFRTMGNALIKTFQDWFGNSPEDFPVELEEAWIKLYCFLANSILQGGIDPVIEYNNTNAFELDEEEEAETTDSFSLGTAKNMATESTLKSSISARFTHHSTKSTASTKSTPKATDTQHQVPKEYNTSSSNFKFRKNKAANKDGDCAIM